MSSIQSLHEAYIAQKNSVTEVVQGRIEQAKKNSRNSCVQVLDKAALEQAKKIDEKLTRLEEKTDLHILEGVPFGVKDCFMVEGSTTTGGAKILENYQSPYTATAVKRLLEVGAVLITKENLDQFGHGSTGENSFFGPTENAQKEGKVAGGSSSGSAVNVASNITTFSLGEDTGGSIRQPAGYNGVVGFKPSYGKISRNGVISYASSLDTVGPITQSVVDTAIVMNVIAGRGENAQDMTTSEYTTLDLETMDTLDLSQTTIGYYSSFLDDASLDADIKEATQNTLNTLKEKGATIEVLDFFPGELLVSTYYVLAMAETASELARLDGVKYGHRSKDIKQRQDIYLNSRGEGFSEETKKRIVLGNQILSAGFENKYYYKALVAREKLKQHFEEDFKKVDFIISPVTPNKIPNIGESLKDPLQMYMSDLYTVGFSLGGLPTLCLPLKSPTGIQVTGAFNDDNNVLRLGYKLEQLYK